MEDNLQKIKRVAEKLNLKFKVKFEKLPVHHKGYFTAQCSGEKGGRYIFKANITNDREIVDSLKRQIIFFNCLTPDVIESVKEKVGSIDTQVMYRGAIEENDFCWLVINYSEGEICGNWFAFNRKYLNDRMFAALGDYPRFIRIINDNLKSRFSGIPIVEKKDYNSYIHRFKRRRERMEEFFGKGIFEEMEKEIEENREFLDKMAVEIVHRDDHPKNLLFDKKTGKVTVIDWSDLSFGNYMYDVTDFWIHAWPDRKWQEKYFEKVIGFQEDREEAIRLFKLNAIRSIYEELAHLSDIDFMKQDKNIDKKQLKKFQKRAIEANLISLDFVMKLKNAR